MRDLAGTDAGAGGQTWSNWPKNDQPRFRTAIAAGLAQAAIACQTVDQQAALPIQQAVASVDEAGFQASFAAVCRRPLDRRDDRRGDSRDGSVGSVMWSSIPTLPATPKPPAAGGSASPRSRRTGDRNDPSADDNPRSGSTRDVLGVAHSHAPE